MPTLRFSVGTCLPGEPTSLPSSQISPASGSSRPAISLREVVLPHPLGPSRTSSSPSSTSKLTSSEAYSLRTPRKPTAAMRRNRTSLDQVAPPPNPLPLHGGGGGLSGRASPSQTLRES